MKRLQITSLVFGVGFVLPVLAQNSVVRFSDISDQDAVAVSSKVAAVYQKPVVAVAHVPHVQPVEANGNNVEIFSMGGAEAVKPVSYHAVTDRDKPEQPTVVSDGPYRFYPKTGAVEYDLNKGLLKPQVITLLLHHRLIDATDDIQWQASDNFIWPNSHTLTGASLDHVINVVLQPYKLVADFKGNGSVIIKKL